MEVESGSVSLSGDGGAPSAPPPRRNNGHAQLKSDVSVGPDVSASPSTPGVSAQRARRFSASFGPGLGSLPSARSPNSSGPRLTPRVSQLRREECADVTNVREVAHERETHSAMQMSQSWEDLTLMGNGLGLGLGGPASPTRAARFSPGVSPSPTRRSFATRRSLSPIAMRPSCLSPVSRPSGLAPAKRRFDLEEAPSAKRPRRSIDGGTPSTPGTPDSIADPTSGFTFRPVSPGSSASASPPPPPPRNPS